MEGRLQLALAQAATRAIEADFRAQAVDSDRNDVRNEVFTSQGRSAVLKFSKEKRDGANKCLRQLFFLKQ